MEYLEEKQLMHQIYSLKDNLSANATALFTLSSFSSIIVIVLNFFPISIAFSSFDNHDCFFDLR